MITYNKPHRITHHLAMAAGLAMATSLSPPVIDPTTRHRGGREVCVAYNNDFPIDLRYLRRMRKAQRPSWRR